MDIGLLALHAIPGVLFMGHGAQKLFGLFGGHGIEGTGGFIEALGLRPGRLHATLAGSAEFFGGLLLALGLFVPFAAAVLIATMVTASLTAHRGKGIWAQDGGFELPLVLRDDRIRVSRRWARVTCRSTRRSGSTSPGRTGPSARSAAGLVGGLGAIASGRLTPPSAARRRTRRAPNTLSTRQRTSGPGQCVRARVVRGPRLSSAARSASRSATCTSRGSAAISGGGCSIWQRRLRAKALTLRREREDLHAPVAIRRAALDQAARLEPVDDPGDVRGVAEQRLRERAHRHLLARLDQPQRVQLHGGEVELLGQPHHARLVRLHQTPDQRPCLDRGLDLLFDGHPWCA